MLGLLKKLFGSKPTVNPCPEAPYKVETPVVTEPSPTPVTEKASEAMVQSVAETKPAKKAPAKKAAPKKETAPKQPGRKPKTK